MSTDTNSSLHPTCSCAPTRDRKIARWTTLGGLIGALGLCSACCLLPFALVTAGVASAWAGTLERLAPYKWALIVITAALLSYGFYVAYRRPVTSCPAGAPCNSRRSRLPLKLGLWIVALLAVAGLVFEQVESRLG